MTVANKSVAGEARVLRLYPSDIQPRLQAILAVLADLDFAFESDLETIQQSAADEGLKQQAMARLHERHHERRAPYLQQLAKLEQRIRALAA
jgi:hypothetical protein